MLSVVTITVLTVQRISPDWPGVKTALDRVESEYPPSYKHYNFTFSSHTTECQVPSGNRLSGVGIYMLHWVSGSIIYNYCLVWLYVTHLIGGVKYL